MAVDSETYMAVCDQVQELRQQLAAANEENERVRQANLDVMMHFEDMKAAKEKVEARVAELEADNAHQRERRNAARDCINKMKAESLRKQAEAVAFVLDKLVEDQPKVSANVTGVINYYAQRLRQQADEAERAGGE